jgi:large subunit ribosomal protein L3
MIQALIGQKIEQTQKFLENGRRIPVTEVSLQDNVVVQVKTEDKDKYAAIQLGYGVKKKPTKALAGHAKKANMQVAPAVLKEVAWDGEGELPNVGDAVTVDSVFQPGDMIDVTGTSKGKGFAGVMKRHNFRGGPKSHGQSDRERAPGSIGQTTTPGRVYRGKRMAGHMGVDTVTVQNLTVIDVDAANKKLYVLGLVPGHKKAMLLITKTGAQKNFVPLLKPAVEEPEAAVEETPVEEPTTVVEAAAEMQAAAEGTPEATEETNEVSAEETAAKVTGEDAAEEKEEVAEATEDKKEEKKA